jgi:hypothetical protein
MLWQDNRSCTEHAIESDELRAHRDPECTTAFFVHLPKTAANLLREHAPELPAHIEWLRVQSRDTQFAEVLDAACADAKPTVVNLIVFRDMPQTTPTWALDPPWRMLFGGGWRRAWSQAACTVNFLAGAPPRLGATVRSVDGVDAMRARVGQALVDMKLPRPGQPRSQHYEGDGWVLVHHPETKGVVAALRAVLDTMSIV